MIWRNWSWAALDGGKTALLRTHGVWSKLVPAFFYPYRFAGGRIYLDITESRMMLARVLGR